MFAYCGNNPVGRTDESGEGWFSSLIVKSVIGGVVNAVCTAVSGGSLSDVAQSFGMGFVETLVSEMVKPVATVLKVVHTVETIADCRNSGASWGASLISGGVTLAASYVGGKTGDLLVDSMVDLTFGLGASLVDEVATTAVKENARQTRNSTQTSSGTTTTQRSSRKGHAHRLSYVCAYIM